MNDHICPRCRFDVVPEGDDLCVMCQDDVEEKAADALHAHRTDLRASHTSGSASAVM